MNVTQKNFEAFKSEFAHYLPKAEFYSFDLEMTGIKTNDFESLSDFPFEKYSKVRVAANKYRIIQVGLCLFIRTGEKEFEARPYNIFVFPRENFGFSPQISIDSGAADFNTRHKMDWNKWFYEGVTYMTMKEIKKKREEMKKEEENPTESAPVKLIKEEELKKSKEFLERLEAWLDSDSTEALIIDEPSRFVRRHIYDVLRKNFPDLVAESIPKEEDSSDKVIQITRFANEQEKEAYFAKKAQEKEEKFLSNVGFTQIIELLINCKKPIVGHNCYLDHLFLFSHFIEYLPYDYDEFKKKLHKMFPEIYDTKFMVNNTKFKSKIERGSSVETLVELCVAKEDPDFFNFKVTLPDEFKAYETGNTENARYHEAGCDAYLTGLIFAKMYFALDKEEQLKVKNVINTMRSLYTIKLGEQDPMLKEHMIYVLRSASKDKDAKINPDDYLVKFEEDKIREKIRFLSLAQGGFPGSMVILEVQSEEDKEIFVKRIQTFAQPKVEVLTYSEYEKVRREKYDKGEKYPR